MVQLLWLLVAVVDSAGQFAQRLLKVVCLWRLDVNERSKLTRFQRLNLTHLLWRKAPRRAALI